MRKPAFASNQIYHIYNRGVEKRKIFLEDKNYFRFIHDMFEFNDENPAPSFNLNARRLNLQNLKGKSPNINIRRLRLPRKPLVEVLAFCLMPNHFHFLLRQLVENGIVRFMHKMGTGYTMYFNQKYERVGGLFQGRFKAVLVECQAHFLTLPHYIHSNPVDLFEPQWRNGGLKDFRGVMRFLESYRWSSYPDYIGKQNFPSVTSRKFLNKFFKNPKQYQLKTKDWLKDINIEILQEVIIEKD